MSDMDEVTVWDPLVRIAHWTLAVSFLVAFVSADRWEELHVAAGYTIAGLAVFRLLWGFIGTSHARFRSFVTSPATLLRYLRKLLAPQPTRYLGHNPAGGWMVVVLLLSLLLTTLTGMLAYGTFSGTMRLVGTALGGEAFDIFSLYDLFEDVHEFLGFLMLLLAVVHVAGVLVVSWIYRENLVRGMITGRKRSQS